MLLQASVVRNVLLDSLVSKGHCGINNRNLYIIVLTAKAFTYPKTILLLHKAEEKIV